MFIKYWRSITLFLTRSKLAMKIAVAEFSVRPKSSIASAVAAWLVGGNKWLQVRQCHSTALRIVARIFNLLLLWQPHFSCQQPPKCVLARHCWNVGKWCLLSTRTPPTPLNSSPSYQNIRVIQCKRINGYGIRSKVNQNILRVIFPVSLM